MEKINKMLIKAYEHFQGKEFEKSLKTLSEVEKTIAADDKNIEDKEMVLASLYNFMGFNYLGLDQLKNSKDVFEKALNLHSGSSQACAGLGEILFLMNMDREAKTMYEWALHNNPNNAFAQAGLAKANLQLDFPLEHNTLNDESGEAEFKRLEKMFKGALSFLHEKEFQKALAIIEKVQSDTENTLRDFELLLSELQSMKGFALLGLEDFDNAKNSFEIALSLNPESQVAENVLKTYFKAG